MKQYLDPLLQRCGVVPRHYWLLLGLFSKLSSRQELMNQNLGHNQPALWVLVFVYGGLATIGALVAVSQKAAESSYLGGFLSLTAIAMMLILLVETANTLVNPVEGVALAHQPINGATYTAAKLTHLGRIVVYLVGAINLVPAMAGYALPTTSLAYPLKHLTLALLEGFAIALGCCAVFGWLLRYVPSSRMKMASHVLTGLMFLALQFRGARAIEWIISLLPLIGPPAQIALALLGVAAIFFGLRTLSADYLIRAQQLVQGASVKRPHRRAPWGLGAVIGRLAGGPAAHAGFAFLTTQARRDWHFLRVLIQMAPALAVISAGILRSTGNPFTGQWSGFLVLPHILGFLIFFLCGALTFGATPEAIWLFRLAPASAFPRFARGVYSGLLFALVLVPHLAAAPALFYLWPAPDAALYLAFSLAVTSLYAAICLGLIDGLPFCSAPRPEHGHSVLLQLVIAGLLAAAAVYAETLFFHSHTLVAAITGILALAALWFSRKSLATFVANIQHDLARRSEKGFYQELS